MNGGKHNQSSHDNFRPPSLSVFYAAAWVLAALFLLSYSSRGVEWASVGVLISAVMATHQLIKALNDRDRLNVFRQQQRAYLDAAWKHGQARFATPEDLDQSEDFD